MKRSVLIGLGIVAIAAATVTYRSWLRIRYVGAFERIPAGATETELLRLAGPPSYTTDGTVDPNGSPRSIRGCAKELWYDVPWAIQKLSFCFNTSGALIYKYNWVSW